MLNWPNILTGIGTIFMAIAIVITAIFAVRNWNKSIKKDKQDITGKLLTEFSNNSEISTGMQRFSNIRIYDSVYESNAKEIISFFAKLGKLLKDDIISVEDIMVYYYNILFYEEKMIIIIDNLKSLVPEIPEHYLKNFNYLMNKISEFYNIKSYKNIIKKSFSPSGEISFSPSASPSSSPSASPSASPSPSSYDEEKK